MLHWKSDSNELAHIILLHCYVASLNMITISASESFGFAQFRCYSISPFPLGSVKQFLGRGPTLFRETSWQNTQRNTLFIEKHRSNSLCRDLEKESLILKNLRKCVAVNTWLLIRSCTVSGRRWWKEVGYRGEEDGSGPPHSSKRIKGFIWHFPCQHIPFIEL